MEKKEIKEMMKSAHKHNKKGVKNHYGMPARHMALKKKEEKKEKK